MNKKRILLVDDDIALSEMVKLNLEETGKYEVCVQNKSILAVATAQRFQPDLVILDCVMPGMDGGDVSARLGEDPFLKKIPRIMVTALISNAETGEAGVVQRGGLTMLAKPIKFEKLEECIRMKLAPA